MNILATVPQADPLGPASGGIPLTPQEFDRAVFQEGWRYELINGVLVVTPLPVNNEVDPSDELGYLLRDYRHHHPNGHCLDHTAFERTIRSKKNRRRVDRAIWAGLGRLPRTHEVPTIAVEFVSRGKRNWLRDYVLKRAEYLQAGVKEYWLIDRFRRTLAVFTRGRGRVRRRVYSEDHVYSTELLPGFELPLARLLELADRWAEDQPE
jgi:Uma2 family endonuclease